MANSTPVWFTDPNANTRPSGDPLEGHRSESYRWDLLTLDGAPAGTLEGVTGGKLEWSTGNTIKGGGNLDLEWKDTPPPDLARHMIQPWYVLTGSAGVEVASWPLGVFLPSTPGDEWSDAGASVSVDLYDKLLILDEETVPETYALAAGTPVVGAVRALIESTGQTRHAIEDSTATLRNAMVWEAGTTKLRIVNDLLDSLNYFSLWCDGEGVYRGDHYTPPAARSVAYEFRDDARSIYLPDFTHERDRFAVPNRVIAVSSSDGETEALVATAENLDPDSPTSYPTRGRWIDRVETDVEASDLATLQAIADRLLETSSQIASTVEIKHALVKLALNDAATFRREPAGLDLRGVVTRHEITCEPGVLASTTIREVST